MLSRTTLSYYNRGGFWGFVARHQLGGIGRAAAANPVMAALPANIPDVPRNRTLIMAVWAAEHFGGSPDLGNFNSYSPTISRSGWTQAATRPFYYNMLGTTSSLDRDRLPVQPDTPADGQLRPASSGAMGSRSRRRMSSSPSTCSRVTGPQQRGRDCPAWCPRNRGRRSDGPDQPNGPTPRFTGTTSRSALTSPCDLPAHLGRAGSGTFTNADLSKGWPVGTGPYKLVSEDVQQKIWTCVQIGGREDGFHALPLVTRLVFLPGMNEITMRR